MMLALCAAGSMAAAQSTPKPTPARHFRLSFVLTYPDSKQPSQTFVMDVPVLPGRPGTSSLNLSSGATGQVEGTTRESLQCTDVHESATGLAAKVNFTIETVAEDHLPDTDEPIHNQLTFERQIDLVLGKPARITEDMHARPLKQGDEALMPLPPVPPQITVTATEI
jgi:hypothetical protein